MDISRRYYKTVSSLTTDKDEITPENGINIYIYEIGGNSAMLSTVNVKILFGDTILMSTHGDTIQKCELSLQGDGVKKLTIELGNASLGAETIGAYFKACTM